MTVYADSLFLVNFISEYILITLSGKICSIHIKPYKKITAASVGSVLSVIIFCTSADSFVISLLRLALSIAIAFICCKSRSNTVKFTVTLIIISYIYGGMFPIVCGIFSNNAFIKNGFTYIDLNPGVFLLIFLCTYPVVLFAAKLIKHKNRIYTVSINQNDNEITTSALFDSGNLLKHNEQSVIIIEWNCVKELFHTESYEELYEHMQDFTLSLIPFSTIGSNGKTLLIFRPDCTVIQEKVFKNIPVGIVNGNISPKGTYHALIGSEYIEGVN